MQGWQTIVEYSASFNQAAYAHAEGWETSASAWAAHAEGYQAQAGQLKPSGEFGLEKGRYSHAEGYQTKTLGISSHAEGRDTVAIG